MWDIIYNFIFSELINASEPSSVSNALANLLTACSVCLLYYVGIRFIGGIWNSLSTLWK